MAPSRSDRQLYAWRVGRLKNDSIKQTGQPGVETLLALLIGKQSLRYLPDAILTDLVARQFAVDVTQNDRIPVLPTKVTRRLSWD